MDCMTLVSRLVLVRGIGGLMCGQEGEWCVGVRRGGEGAGSAECEV
jgi:hypothetical protein